ncbi:hypothetical protein ACOME3_009865 [Neoechinorhynchus agilis]
MISENKFEPVSEEDVAAVKDAISQAEQGKYHRTFIFSFESYLRAFNNDQLPLISVLNDGCPKLVYIVSSAIDENRKFQEKEYVACLMLNHVKRVLSYNVFRSFLPTEIQFLNALGFYVFSLLCWLILVIIENLDASTHADIFAFLFDWLSVLIQAPFAIGAIEVKDQMETTSLTSRILNICSLFSINGDRAVCIHSASRTFGYFLNRFDISITRLCSVTVDVFSHLKTSDNMKLESAMVLFYEMLRCMDHDIAKLLMDEYVCVSRAREWSMSTNFKAKIFDMKILNRFCEMIMHKKHFDEQILPTQVSTSNGEKTTSKSGADHLLLYAKSVMFANIENGDFTCKWKGAECLARIVAFMDKEEIAKVLNRIYSLTAHQSDVNRVLGGCLCLAELGYHKTIPPFALETVVIRGL